VRYLKGSVELGDRDRKLLEVVANANKITQPQLFEISVLKQIESGRRLFDRRVRRLANAGLLKREQVSFLGSRRLYSITRTASTGWKTAEYTRFLPTWNVRMTSITISRTHLN
jgi:predicted transcriptional regulator